MGTEENVAIVRRYYEDFSSRGDLAVADTILAPGAVFREPHQTLQGADSIKRRVAAFRIGFPDLTLTMGHVVAAGDMVATSYTLTGTNTGPFAGAAPTGKRVTMEGMAFYRLADGRIVEGWGCADFHGFLQQIETPSAQ